MPQIFETAALIIAAVCFLLAALGVNGRVNLVALGLFFWVLTVIPWGGLSG